jgi:hypothetical protein
MRALSPLTIGVVVFSVLFGSAIGALTARVPAFGSIGIPSFLWLVAGQFAFEMLVGIALRAHPSVLIAMPLRFAALVLSFLSCYATVAILSSS